MNPFSQLAKTLGNPFGCLAPGGAERRRTVEALEERTPEQLSLSPLCLKTGATVLEDGRIRSTLHKDPTAALTARI